MAKMGKTQNYTKEFLKSYLEEDPIDLLEWSYSKNNREYFNRIAPTLGYDHLIYKEWIWICPKIKNKIKKCLAINIASHIIQNTKLNEILPFTMEELIIDFSKKFKDGMSWSNHGKWHIDHIKPKYNIKFNNFTDESFIKCWSLENLQPLWACENMKKGIH